MLSSHRNQGLFDFWHRPAIMATCKATYVAAWMPQWVVRPLEDFECFRSASGAVTRVSETSGSQECFNRMSSAEKPQASFTQRFSVVIRTFQHCLGMSSAIVGSLRNHTAISVFSCRILFHVLAAFTMIACIPVSAAAPYQCVPNGHYYDTLPTLYSFQNAAHAASILSFLGWRGHLATITSAAESQCVASVVAFANTTDPLWIAGMLIRPQAQFRHEPSSRRQRIPDARVACGPRKRWDDAGGKLVRGGTQQGVGWQLCCCCGGRRGTGLERRHVCVAIKGGGGVRVLHTNMACNWCGGSR
jgi:hypothetical protein